MNTVEKHETDHRCNVCGGVVVNQYGTLSCGNGQCETTLTGLSWDSTDDEILAYRDDQLDTITINGAYSDAEIKTTDVDDTCVSQVQEIVNHEAFERTIKIMPDAHAGAGAVIGFTMPLGDKICPNTVGVDIGCGMTAYELGGGSHFDYLEDHLREADEAIRDAVPLGYNTFADVEAEQDYHLLDDFPWEDCEWKARSINNNLSNMQHLTEEFGPDYFDELCERVEYDPTRAINSLGTLGGGNHFIEISESEQTGNYWVVVHSGSRGIGLSIAQYWQEVAHRNCDERTSEVRHQLSSIPDEYYRFDLETVSDEDLLNWLQGGMGEDWKDTDAIADDLDGSAIGAMVDRLREVASIVRDNDGGHELDYLDGIGRAGYLKDMIFAQTYAEQSRHLMCQNVCEALGTEPGRIINSTHNYIDFDDLVIRKGATRAREGDEQVIPFNMRDGAVIVEGLGNPRWNWSAPHGAGRRGSRRWAHETFDVGEFAKEMNDVFSTSVNENTLDEAPMAYKDHETILDHIDGVTVDVVDTLTPVLNVKAE